jgi:hypothetical protein
MNCACEEPGICVGWQQLTGNCMENSCKLHRAGMHLLSETDMCSRFSGGNKQTKEPYFIISSQMASLTFPLLYKKQ